VSHYLSALIGTGVVQEGIRFDFESILHDATLVGLIVLASFLARRGLRAPALIRDFFRNVLSFGWFYTILRWFYRQLGSAINFISTILEGEGGILWALLLVTLLIAFLSQDGSLRR
jgi:hypothetical protein